MSPYRRLNTVGFVAPTVWLHYRFPLSPRHVEEMPLERGVAVFDPPYEPVYWDRRLFGARDQPRRVSSQRQR